MGKKLDLLTGTKVLEEVKSPINGKIRVVRTLGLGTYIQVENLTQSGGVVHEVWRTTLRKVQSSKFKVQNCLILGLGGGSAAGLVKRYWPESRITGVEIDPIMVDLGRKYLGLEESIEVVIQDAFSFLTNHKSQVTNHFDLILVDTYIGDKFPDKFETEDFLKLILGLLTKGGIAVFNRLYYGEKRKEAEKFHRKLIHVFKKVIPVYPEANVMYLCSG